MNLFVTQCQTIDTATEQISTTLYCCCVLVDSATFGINQSGTQRLIDWCPKQQNLPIGNNNREQQKQHNKKVSKKNSVKYVVDIKNAIFILNVIICIH